MTNLEVFNIVKEGDPIKIKGVLPNHYLAKGDKFVLPEGSTKYGTTFDTVGSVAELDKWYTHNYALSGKYSDDLTMVLLPEGPNIRIEVKDNKIFKVMWAVGGIFVDITHNANFLGGIPIGRMPSYSGYLHGTVVSKLKEDELYKLLIAPVSDERILDCKFVVSYAYFFPIMFDNIKDMFEALRNIGFNTASFITTTIPKWSRAIENAKLMAGGGTLGYGCTNVLTAYSDMKMIEMLSGNVANWWGVTTEIPPTALFEVVGIAWTAVIDNNRVNVIPVISFKYGDCVLGEIKNDDIVVDDKFKILYKMVMGFETKDINEYCIGDMFDAVIGGGILTMNRRFGSKNYPLVTPGCPKCGQGVDVSSGKVYCVNTKCPTVVLNNIKVWIDKFCPDVNKYLMEEFLLKYEISNIGDIYTVIDSSNKFISEYDPIYYGVKNSREVPDEFLHIFMPFLTIEQCKNIAMSFSLLSNDPHSSMKHIFAPSTLARCLGDEKIVDKILEFLDINRAPFTRIMCSYYAPPSHPSYIKIYKRTFFIDGLLYDKDRVKYERIINGYCGRVVSDFAPYINGFIYGEYVDRAVFEAVKELATHKDVAIYSEEEFNKLVDQADGGTL